MAVPRLLKPCETRRSHLTCHVRPRPLAFCVTLMFSNAQRLTKVEAMIYDFRYNTLALSARPGWLASQDESDFVSESCRTFGAGQTCNRHSPA